MTVKFGEGSGHRQMIEHLFYINAEDSPFPPRIERVHGEGAGASCQHPANVVDYGLWHVGACMRTPCPRRE